MDIRFHGAAGEVTGSCSEVTTGAHHLMIDCGMFQGTPELEAKNDFFSFDPHTITHVLVTHAHLDHVGRLPLLVKRGYKGFIYSTPPTRDLAELIMEDTFQIMSYNHRKNGAPLLYTLEDIARVMELFKVGEYEQPMTLVPGEVTAIFHDAGHVFGSSFIEILAEGKRIVFTGDVGNVNVPILRDTAVLPAGIDLLVSESTYGDRLHENAASRDRVVENMIAEALRPGGVVMIPSFSLERTQELIYELNDLVDRQHRLPRIPIFLDSPLAIDALKVYLKYPHFYDAAAEKYIRNGDELFTFPGLTMTYTREESKRINQMLGPKIIIAGSGMMNGGRILHHALRYLSDEKNTLLLIGYQSHGTLGRALADGAKTVDVLGEHVRVGCHIKMVGSLSAHADQKKLVSWITDAGPRRVILNHGDASASQALAHKLGEHGVSAEPAKLATTFTV